MINEYKQCIGVDDADYVTSTACETFSPETRWNSFSTKKKMIRLMNIKTLQCVDVASASATSESLPITMKPCSLTSSKQALSCNNDGVIWKKYLDLASPTGQVPFSKKKQMWIKYPKNSGNLCNDNVTYTGMCSTH